MSGELGKVRRIFVHTRRKEYKYLGVNVSQLGVVVDGGLEVGECKVQKL